VQQKIYRLFEVRVKRCGKSTPHIRQLIMAWQTPSGARPNRGPNVSPDRARVGCLNFVATQNLDE